MKNPSRLAIYAFLITSSGSHLYADDHFAKLLELFAPKHLEVATTSEPSACGMAVAVVGVNTDSGEQIWTQSKEAKRSPKWSALTPIQRAEFLSAFLQDQADALLADTNGTA